MKATKIDEIFTVDLTVTTYCQIVDEVFVNFCGLLRKRELYHKIFQATSLRSWIHFELSSFFRKFMRKMPL